MSGGTVDSLNDLIVGVGDCYCYNLHLTVIRPSNETDTCKATSFLSKTHHPFVENTRCIMYSTLST